MKLAAGGDPRLEGRLQGGGKWLYFFLSVEDVKESLEIEGRLEQQTGLEWPPGVLASGR